MKTKVAVLRGGPSSEYEVSLKTGSSVLKFMPHKYKAIDVLIDKDGIWHIDGVPFKPHDLHLRADVAFIAMHGEYGEDGKIQKILEDLKMPFTGSKSLPSAIGINKVMSKMVFQKEGIKTPLYKTFNKKDWNDEEASRLFKTFPHPAVVKPVSRGSSVGVNLVFNLSDLKKAFEKVFEIDDNCLIEEMIKGKEATCGVLEHFRKKEIYSLLPVEILPKKKLKGEESFFDYESKYSETNGADERCPGNFTKKEGEEMQRLAIETHKAIGARHYSRTDFIVHPKRGIYVLEINTLPGLTATSLLPKEMTAIGSSYGELLEHLIELALKK